MKKDVLKQKRINLVISSLIPTQSYPVVSNPKTHTPYPFNVAKNNNNPQTLI
jgi:hypothetical protein